MNILIVPIAVLAVSLVWLAASVIATRIVYGFRLKALLGLERQYKRTQVMYVSRGSRAPTAVFWLGSNDWQENKVAEGMASGLLPRQDFTESVSDQAHRDAVHRRVPVWPSVESKRLYGQPCDVGQPDHSS